MCGQHFHGKNWHVVTTALVCVMNCYLKHGGAWQNHQPPHRYSKVRSRHPIGCALKQCKATVHNDDCRAPFTGFPSLLTFAEADCWPLYTFFGTSTENVAP